MLGLRRSLVWSVAIMGVHLVGCGEATDGDTNTPAQSATSAGTSTAGGAASNTSASGAASSAGTNPGVPSASQAATGAPGASNVPPGMPSGSTTAPVTMPSSQPANCPATAPTDGDTCEPSGMMLGGACTYDTTLQCRCVVMPTGGGMGGFPMGGDAGADVAPAPSATTPEATTGTWTCNEVQPPPECPATQPADGTECSQFQSCDYDAVTCRCAGMGGMGGMGGGQAAARSWTCGEGGMIPGGMPSGEASTPMTPPSTMPSTMPSAMASMMPSAMASMMPPADDADALWAAAWSVLTETCAGAGCHTHSADDTTRPVGGFGIDPMDEEYSRMNSEAAAGEIVGEVQRNSMPPQQSGITLTAEQKQALSDWADSL